MALPGAEMVALGAEWLLLRQLCIEKRLTGNALPDAWLAAAVIHHGEHLVTFDSDFRKLATTIGIRTNVPPDALVSAFSTSQAAARS